MAEGAAQTARLTAFAVAAVALAEKGDEFMNREEWIELGYANGIIKDVVVEEQVYFGNVYQAWFKMKINRIRPQSVDRIEVVYNKYYRGTELEQMPVHLITEQTVYKFINDIILRYGTITHKEYQRIYQIVYGVMQYAVDLDMGHAKMLNWSVVKRYIAVDNFASTKKKELCVSMEERQRLFHCVLVNNIYPEKRSASLCLLLNFYLGLRIGELASLRWQDVNFSERYVYIHTTEVKAYERDGEGNRVNNIAYVMQDRTKTFHSVRRIPLINESIYILNELRSWHNSKGYTSEYLAYDGVDTILTRSLERTLRRLCNLCEVSQFSSHKIRKTFASELHRFGVPTKMISEIMGHAEMRTTEQSYIISYSDSMDVVREAMQKGLMVAL